jgi:chemotaxis protein MotB
VLFDKVNAQSPINRRISIIVMTKQAEDSALRTESRPEMPTTLLPPDLTAPAGPPPAQTTQQSLAPPAPALAVPAPAPRVVPGNAVDTAKPYDGLPDRPPLRGTEAPVAPADGAPGL